ncbi:MAG: hypothetical protein ACXAC5_18615 [Promethearchaeota archaeon]|jgi:hypothetical protein
MKNECKIEINVYKEEMETFYHLIVTQGHLANLDKEYRGLGIDIF